MLSVVTGKQRSGKTFCVLLHWIIPALQAGRSVVTNLPLFPDQISREFLRGRKDFDLKILSMEESLEFWIHKKPESLVVLDEAYEIFPATVTLALKTNISRRLKDKDYLPFYFKDYDKSQGLLSPREIWYMQQAELQSYVRQHGHYKDDLVIISHNPLDLHAFVLRGAMEFVFLKNSLRQNIFKFHLLEGLTFPKQFFIMRHYDTMEEMKKGTHSMERYYDPRSDVFKCYDSFSTAIRVSNDDKASLAPSSDFNRPYRYVVFQWLKDKFPAMFFCALVFSLIATFIYTLASSAVSTGPVYKPAIDSSALTIDPIPVSDVDSVRIDAPSPVLVAVAAVPPSPYDLPPSSGVFGPVLGRSRSAVEFESVVLTESFYQITNKGVLTCKGKFIPYSAFSRLSFSDFFSSQAELMRSQKKMK